MASLGEEFENLQAKISRVAGRERTVDTFEQLARELKALDYRLRTTALPSDELADLGRLSAQARADLDRQLNDLRYPTHLSPQINAFSAFAGLDGFNRGYDGPSR